MKILVDSSLTSKKPWFELIPININVDQETLCDKNDEHHTKKIINAKKISTSFCSPENVKKLKGDRNIIFTLPKTLSGQFDSYNANINDEKTIIIEGTSLITAPNKVKNIIETYKDFEVIKHKIDKLNRTIEMNGFITDFSSVPKKGRISSIGFKIFKTMQVKVWIKFQKSKWTKIKIIRNLTKSIINILDTEETDMINVIYHLENKDINKKLAKIAQKRPSLVINKHRITNAMLAHSGQGFMAIF